MAAWNGRHRRAVVYDSNVTAAVCESALTSGACGVQAVGRCVHCERAFCQSHQDLVRGVIQVNVCSECGQRGNSEHLNGVMNAVRERATQGGDRSPGEIVSRLIRSYPERAVSVHRLASRREGLLKKRSVRVPEVHCAGWPLGVQEVQHLGRGGSVMGANRYETFSKRAVITDQGTCAVWYDNYQCFLEGELAIEVESWKVVKVDAQDLLFREAQALGVDLTA